MDGPLAFGADFSVDSATHPANGLTESLQSIARTPVDSVCLESPVLVVSAPAWLVVALSSSVPLRRGGQAGPAQRLLPCVPPTCSGAPSPRCDLEAAGELLDFLARLGSVLLRGDKRSPSPQPP